MTLENIEQVYETEISLKNIQGIDRIDSYEFNRKKKDHFAIIQRKCLTGSYRFSPYLEKLSIRGRDRPPRVISIATIRDRIVLSILKEYLHLVFPDCVNRQLPNTFIKTIKEDYGKIVKNKKTNTKALCLFKADINTFYDNIKHDKLLEILFQRIENKPDLMLLKHAIQTKTVPSDCRRADTHHGKNLIGVPQGLAISNILANIYLRDFDEIYKAKSQLYLRYVDDMIFVVKDTEKEELKKEVQNHLINLGLDDVPPYIKPTAS
jgi:retron-type reverse transcriptase